MNELDDNGEPYLYDHRARLITPKEIEWALEDGRCLLYWVGRLPCLVLDGQVPLCYAKTITVPSYEHAYRVAAGEFGIKCE